MAPVGSPSTPLALTAASPLVRTASPMSRQRAVDPTSALMAASFATHGGIYQAASGVATAFHEMMVAMLGTNAATYAATEALNAAAAM